MIEISIIFICVGLFKAFLVYFVIYAVTSSVNPADEPTILNPPKGLEGFLLNFNLKKK